MTLFKTGLATALMHSLAFLSLLSPSFAAAQNQTAVGLVTVSIILNGVGPTRAPVAGACDTRTLFNESGAVIRVTCVNDPFVSIAPSTQGRFPGNSGRTFRYPLFSNPNQFDFGTAGFNNFNQLSGNLNNVGSSLRIGGNNAQTIVGDRSSSGDNATNSRFNSPTSTVTDMSIYREEPQAKTDPQEVIDMVIIF